MEACAVILHRLGIHGWKQADKTPLLASLLTGGPLLLIGNHGCSKTHVATKLARADRATPAFLQSELLRAWG